MAKLTAREISGKANYLGYCHSRKIVPHWDLVDAETKEAWIAGAYEALVINHIVQQGVPKETA